MGGCFTNLKNIQTITSPPVDSTGHEMFVGKTRLGESQKATAEKIDLLERCLATVHDHT